MKKILTIISFGFLFSCLIQTAWALPSKGLVIGCSIFWEDGVYPPESYNYEAYSHIIRTGLANQADGSITVPNGFFDPVLEKNAHLHGIKLLAALVGGGVVSADNWLLMARNPQAEKNLFDHLEKLIADNRYDGVDIDWEPSALNDADQATFTQFMKDLRQRFPQWIISVDLGLGGDYWAKHISWPEVAAQVDLVNLMAYDYAGAWHGRATHNSNLYPPADAKNGDLSMDGAVSLVLGKYHLPPEKVVLGLSFYGREFFVDKMGDVFPANSGKQGTELRYREIAPLLNAKNYVARWDDTAKAPYMERTDGGLVVTYDDAKSIRLKCEYALKKGFKGVFMWVMGGDVLGNRTPLLDAVCQTMGSPSEPIPVEGLQKSFPYFASLVKVAREELTHAQQNLAQAGKSVEAKAADPGPEPDLSMPSSKYASVLGNKILQLQTLLTLAHRVDEKAQAVLDSVPVTQVMGAKLAPAEGRELWVDDFEGDVSSKNLGGRWLDYCDQNNLGTVLHPTPFTVSEGGCPSSPGHAAHIWGHYGKNIAPWPFVGLTVSLDPAGQEVDLSTFISIGFWTKGDGKTYSLVLNRAAVKDYSSFRHDFSTTPTWTKVILKLADFIQPDWGKRIPLGWTDVQNLSFTVSTGTSDQDFDLWVDDLVLVQ